MFAKAIHKFLEKVKITIWIYLHIQCEQFKFRLGQIAKGKTLKGVVVKNKCLL